MKPVINLEDLELQPEEDGPDPKRYGVICARIGAQKLGYNLSIVPPGKRANPFHNHRINEEMFLILAGEGILRFGSQEYPVRKHDVIACPPGARDVAHQLRNTGDTDLEFLALSTKEGHEICEFPDVNQVKVSVGDYGSIELRHTFDVDRAVEGGPPDA